MNNFDITELDWSFKNTCKGKFPIGVKEFQQRIVLIYEKCSLFEQDKFRKRWAGGKWIEEKVIQ